MKTLAIDTGTTREATTTQLRIVPQTRAPKHGSFTSDVYRLHSYRVVDSDGKKLGIVDWIWKDQESGKGEFLGVNLRWLRGTTRAIPTLGAEINHETSTIRVAYTADQIKRVPRFKIDRPLTAREKRRIYLSYELEPSRLHTLVPAQNAA